MPGELLLDTGALVSLLDRSQPLHFEFVSFFEKWTAPVASTEAVLTEAMHLLGRIPNGGRACLDFFLDGGSLLVPSTHVSLRRSSELLQKYADLPMDFADSTLVVLAEDLATDLIFTTDVRDFEVYRIDDRKRFKILPSRPVRSDAPSVAGRTHTRRRRSDV